VEVYEAATTLVDALPFPDECFDLVLDRHSAFNAAEVARVLTLSGTFLTQQVDGRQTDLQAAFDAEPPFSYFTLDFALALLRSVPLQVELAQDWTGEMRFADVGALVYYLKAIPWLVPNFSVETHLPYLEDLHQRLEAEGALIFHQTRMLLRATKR
jgi:hypothetical protein